MASRWSGRSGYTSFEFMKRSQKPKLSIADSVTVQAYAAAVSHGQKELIHAHPRSTHTQATECVTIQCMQTHVNAHTRVKHAYWWIHLYISQFLDRSSRPAHAMMSTTPSPSTSTFWMDDLLRQIEMQAVKIASIASIVKRPRPDESQPKWVLLPGRAALLSSVSRGRLECLCLPRLSSLFFFLPATLQTRWVYAWHS